MQTEMLMGRPKSPPRALTIDCSRSPETALQSVLTWVSGLPERHSIHVILPQMRGQAMHRQALSSLMILGCRVTSKI
jgi:hypothetical protein